MALSLSELKDRAIRFAQDWQGETREHAEAKPFWTDFFNVFGINRRRLASFEEPVIIRGLFLDELEQELRTAGHDRRRLDALHRRLERTRFLDPSCGCGNFLVVTYRELRRLEFEILERLFADRRATGQILGKCA